MLSNLAGRSGSEVNLVADFINLRFEEPCSAVSGFCGLPHPAAIAAIPANGPVLLGWVQADDR